MFQPSVLSSSGNAVAQGASGNLVGGVSSGASAGLGIVSALGVTSAAIPIAGAAIAGVAAIVGALLAAHEKRMQDAKTENQRVAAAVPSFYQTLVAIVNAYNSGQLTAQDAITALNQLDQVTYNSLRQFVGSPGTAWNSNQSGVCDKTCTVGCCIYNTYLHADIAGAGAVRGVAQLLAAGPSDPIWRGGKKQCAGIPTNKYSFPGYPAFSITLKDPTSSGVAGLVGDLASPLQNIATEIGLPATVGGFSTGTILLFVVGALLIRKVLA